MANVLPETGYKDVLREYRLRLATLVVGALFLLALLGVIVLLPSFFLSQARAVAVEDQIKLVEEAVERQEATDAAERLAAAKIQLSVLTIGLEHVSAADLIADVVDERESISLTSFALTRRGESEEGELVIKGVAPTRETLTTFAARLRQNQLFRKVELPVESLARDRDLAFSITLLGEF